MCQVFIQYNKNSIFKSGVKSLLSERRWERFYILFLQHDGDQVMGHPHSCSSVCFFVDGRLLWIIVDQHIKYELLTELAWQSELGCYLSEEWEEVLCTSVHSLILKSYTGFISLNQDKQRFIKRKRLFSHHLTGSQFLGLRMSQVTSLYYKRKWLTLPATCWLLLQWKSPSPLTVALWFQDTISFLELEKIKSTLRGKNWQVLSKMDSLFVLL